MSAGDNRSRRVLCTHYDVDRSCLLAVPTLPPFVVQLVTLSENDVCSYMYVQQTYGLSRAKRTKHNKKKNKEYVNKM